MILLNNVVRELLLRCRRESPGSETCGFLVVDGGNQQKFIRCLNLAEVPGAFAVPEQDIQRVRRMAAANKWSITAFIHTHLNSSHPSQLDRLTAQALNEPLLIVYFDDASVAGQTDSMVVREVLRT